MSVTGPSYNINAIKGLSEAEIAQNVPPERSWHRQYKDSCYIFVGGLPYGLNEGDVAVVFSQWGEIVDIHLVRDKKTGTSKGFAFVGYEDQRSTDLAVDNFNSYELLGRRLRVDHCARFRAPKTPDGDTEKEEYKPTGAEGLGYGVYADDTAEGSRSQALQASPQAPLQDADEQWAREFEKTLARDQEARRERRKEGRKRRDRSHSDRFSERGRVSERGGNRRERTASRERDRGTGRSRERNRHKGRRRSSSDATTKER